MGLAWACYILLLFLTFVTWLICVFCLHIGLAATRLVQYMPKNTDLPFIKGLWPCFIYLWHIVLYEETVGCHWIRIWFLISCRLFTGNCAQFSIVWMPRTNPKYNCKLPSTKDLGPFPYQCALGILAFYMSKILHTIQWGHIWSAKCAKRPADKNAISKIAFWALVGCIFLI